MHHFNLYGMVRRYDQSLMAETDLSADKERSVIIHRPALFAHYYSEEETYYN